MKVGDEAFRLPKPFELGVAGTIAGRLVEQMVDDQATGALFAKRMGFAFMETLALNPSPGGLTPVLEVAQDVSWFTGQSIEGLAFAGP